ncbi:hypothetical protein [Paraburkholderia sp. J11-2]|uniref:hypothetical protein n=1 Tax=Paraburkholderia sp. J11-2 TaxID=2805431 RepID=UPI002AB79E13|nr:hypothetical protein [Paraburkholderia sp. J11-2]
MFLIVVLLVGEVDSSRTVLLLPRSSTVFLDRISAVLPGDDGSGQRGRKRGINATANARFALRLHDYGETLALRQRSSGESIDVARRAHQDIVFRTKPLLTLEPHGADMCRMPIAASEIDAQGARKTGPQSGPHIGMRRAPVRLA